MKYKMRYRKIGIQLNTAPTEIEPTPMTREGARSLVERFTVLNKANTLGDLPSVKTHRLSVKDPTQVGVGVYPGWVRATSLTSLPTLKPKRDLEIQ